MARILPSLAAVAAAIIGIVAAVTIGTRSDQDTMAIEPTAVPSPTLTAQEPDSSPPGDVTPEPTLAPATEAPTVEPTEPPVADPTDPGPTTPPDATGEPMPHTGGGAVLPGTVLAAAGALLGLRVRRSY